ncbi:MAG: hypothetical protein KDA27_27045, partial [Candidatus Eisenbacteria bacterium]|nr:hypothetical protein [Candidatus Eisenbacteria bacterium]
SGSGGRAEFLGHGRWYHPWKGCRKGGDVGGQVLLWGLVRELERKRGVGSGLRTTVPPKAIAAYGSISGEP